MTAGTFDLASFAKPMTRAQALKAGELVDTSSAAAFLGFRVPAALTRSVWQELVGTPSVAATSAERTQACDQLRRVWVDAQNAVMAYRSSGAVLNSIPFKSRTVQGTAVALRLECTLDESHRSVLTIFLEGER